MAKEDEEGQNPITPPREKKPPPPLPPRRAATLGGIGAEKISSEGKKILLFIINWSSINRKFNTKGNT